MPNEGKLGSFQFSGERVATDDHPVILQALPMDATATTSLGVGTILTRVVDEDVDGATYAAATEAQDPYAVLDQPFDPSTDTSAICVLHGTVKTRLLKVGSLAPSLNMLDKLQKQGIFAV